MDPTNTTEPMLPAGSTVPPVYQPHMVGLDPVAATTIPATAMGDALAPDNDAAPFAPPHTHTESTQSPTSEFMRYVLAAAFIRYIFRGGGGGVFSDPKDRPVRGIGKWVMDKWGLLGDWLEKRALQRDPAAAEGVRVRANAAAYSTSLGLGSLLLTASYTNLVYKDIRNMFSEAVGAELGKPAEQVNFNDIRHSQNRIVKKTLENFSSRLWHRLAIDILFFPAAMLRHVAPGDFVLGLKGLQLFMETWKRKTTMFEDLISFVNNKINPRNGLGQPIAVGEIFDLYQHYEQEFNPDRAFTNVLERGTGEGARWAKSEPIFRRITELMNHTYAYKHPSIIDPQTGHAVRQANFPLPTFIYLLGNDLIDLRNPERTQVVIEVANHNGIDGVKEMQSLLAAKQPLSEIMTHFGVHLPAMSATPLPAEQVAKVENGVIIKGSSVQLNSGPAPRIATDSVQHTPPTGHAPQLA